MEDRKRTMNFCIMYLLLFLFWILLSGSLDLFNIITGLVISYLVSNLSIKIFGKKIDFWYRPKQLFLLVKFFIKLILEIIKANFSMARIIIDPNLPVSPGMVRFKVGLKSDLAKVVLANTITLTPGTLTIEIDEDEFIVHVIAKENIEGLFSNELKELLLKIEEEEYANSL